MAIRQFTRKRPSQRARRSRTQSPSVLAARRFVHAFNNECRSIGLAELRTRSVVQ